MDTRLSHALAVTMEVSGRSLAEACKRTIIYLAESARALTRQSKKKRRVRREKGLEYINVRKKDGTLSKLFKFKFLEQQGAQQATWGKNFGMMRGTWEQAQIIGGRGLAKRSWMWGLKGMNNVKSVGKSIPGVGRLRKILTAEVGGFILSNKLSYILKAMPAGWKQIAEQKATNKIMKQAETKLKRDWARAVQRTGSQRNTKPDMAKYIRRVA